MNGVDLIKCMWMNNVEYGGTNVVWFEEVHDPIR